MRSAALALLAALSPGCNQVFGLDETQPAPPIDTLPARARLTYLVATTDATGTPIPQPATPAIEPAPSVKIGPLDGALIDADYGADGSFVIPDDFVEMTWRLVYQLPGEVTREVQWKPAPDRGHAVVPRFGRIDPAPIPGPNSAYSVTPGGAPGAYSSPRLFTTGVWMESANGAVTGPTQVYNVGQSSFRPLVGVKGAPEVSKGDRQVLIDFGPDNTCSSSLGSAAFQVDLTAGTATPATQPTWTYKPQPATVAGAFPLDVPIRVATQIGGNPAALPSRARIGIGPTTAMPVMSYEIGQPIPAPVMITLLDCASPAASPNWTTPPFGRPDMLPDFAQLAWVQVTSSRLTMPGGMELAGGIAAVNTGMDTFTLDFRVPFATSFRIDGMDLATGDDRKAPTGGAAPMVLEFDLETNAGSAQYYEVTLHTIAGSVTPERVFTVTEPRVSIDRALLTKGTEYVFEVRAFRGARVDVKDGDFTGYVASQAMTTIFSRTFIAP